MGEKETKPIEFWINKIHCEKMGLCNALKEIPDNSIDLTITSPPYNVGKEYENVLTEDEYYSFLKPMFKEIYRVSVNDGRFCVNVAFNMNQRIGKIKKVIYPFLTIVDLLRDVGFKIREDIIWDQGCSGCNTAWGSWRSASAPWFRHVTEHILICYKKTWYKHKKVKNSIPVKQFMSYSRDRWKISPEKSKSHPAPFPLELPRRLILMLSYKGDIVLDPFVGSGTTCVAAKQLDRKWIGIDCYPKYCQIASTRLGNCEIVRHDVNSSQQLEIKQEVKTDGVVCPKCGSKMYKGKRAYYCTKANCDGVRERK